MSPHITYRPLTAAVALGAFLFASAILHGEERRASDEAEVHTLPTQARSSESEMRQYFFGRQYKSGAFSGRLVCLRCDTMPTAENVEVCRKDGHRHALAMEGDTMVHPLIFTSGDLFSRVNTHNWYRKKVQVWGRYYADTGYILVGNIEAVEE